MTYIDSNFYCIDINFNSIWIASFSINRNREIDIKFINKRSIANLFQDGRIKINFLEKEIRKVINVIESKTGETIHSIYLTSGLLNVYSQIHQIHLDIGKNKQVNNKHIEQSLRLLHSSISCNDRGIIHVIPMEFKIDIGSVDNPVGHKTPDLLTTYNVIMVNSYLLTVIKNIFEKYQISVDDVFSHSYLLSKFILNDTEKTLPILLIDIKQNSININFVFKGKLLKCSYLQDLDLVNEYMDQRNIYDVLQRIKNIVPGSILNFIKKVIIYSSIQPDPVIIQTLSDIFEVDCKMVYNGYKTNTSIYYLIRHVAEEIIDENDYLNVSGKTLNMLSRLKDFIADTL